MTTFLAVAYPGVLGATAVLFLAGAVAAVWIRAHRALEWIVSAFWAVTAVEVLWAIALVIGGGAPAVITLGYALAAVALLPVLGISRLGAPEAAADDPGRPVLQPDQMARVDGVAAMIVAVAAAVVVWRIAVIFEGAV